MINEVVNNLIEKGKRSVEAAKRLSESGDYDFSVARAYYAMFYCAEALLFTKDLSFSKHSAVIAAFGKHFVKTGLLPSALHSYLGDAFKDRQTGDYEAVIAISKEQAGTHIKNAEEFLAQTIEYMEGLK
jgi:uncharacterized protein (UPF0332 family)